MKPRYTGLLIVIKRNHKSAYILAELDGSVHHHPIAAFHVIPYLLCKTIPLPENWHNIMTAHLAYLENSETIDN
jgi:hypothetical protein